MDKWKFLEDHLYNLYRRADDRLYYDDKNELAILERTIYNNLYNVVWQLNESESNHGV